MLTKCPGCGGRLIQKQGGRNGVVAMWPECGTCDWSWLDAGQGVTLPPARPPTPSSFLRGSNPRRLARSIWRPRVAHLSTREPSEWRDLLYIIAIVVCIGYVSVTAMVLFEEMHAAQACYDAGYDDFYIGVTAWCIQAESGRFVDVTEVTEETIWQRIKRRTMERLGLAEDGLAEAGECARHSKKPSSVESVQIRVLSWPRVAPLQVFSSS